MKALVIAITPKRALWFMTCAALFLLSIGISLLVTSQGLQYCELSYSVAPDNPAFFEINSRTCPRLVAPLKGRFAVFYKLEPYYQNHKEFRRGIDYSQLFGTVHESSKSLSSCRPYLTDDDGKILHPCGGIPRTVFTDRFVLYRDPERQHEIVLDESRSAICNERGVHTLYKNPSEEDVLKHSSRVNFWMKDEGVRRSLNMDKPGVGEGVENAHFINWIEVSSTSTVQKLYGIFDSTDVELPIYMLIDTTKEYPSIVKKSVILERRSRLGHTGRMMGIAYIVVASLLMFMVSMTLLFSGATRLRHSD